jgi:GxxExxY protein
MATAIVYGDLTLHGLITIAKKVYDAIGMGRKESHYQRCLMTELHALNIPAKSEDPVPVFYKGTMVWQGRADIVIGDRFCVELKANGKPPSHATRQLLDYIQEKNKVIVLHHAADEDSPLHERMFWGVVINFNSSLHRVEHLVVYPPKRPITAGRLARTDCIHIEDREPPRHRLGDQEQPRRRQKDEEPHDYRPGDQVVYDGNKRAMVRAVKLNSLDMQVVYDLDMSGGEVLYNVHSEFIAPVQNIVFDRTVDAYSHRDLITDLDSFCQSHLQKTANPGEYVPFLDILHGFERFAQVKVIGSPKCLWIRRHMQRRYRVTYSRSPRERDREVIVFGGLQRGLKFS